MSFCKPTQLGAGQTGLGMSADANTRESLQGAQRTCWLEPCKHRIGSGKPKPKVKPVLHREWRAGHGAGARAASGVQQNLVLKQVFQQKSQQSSVLGSPRVEDKYRKLHSTDSCSIPGTHRSDVSSNSIVPSQVVNANHWTNADTSSKADEIKGAIDALKEQMESGMTLVEDTLQETSSLKAEFTVLQTELQELCSAFMLDDVESIKNAAESVQAPKSKRKEKCNVSCVEERVEADDDDEDVVGIEAIDDQETCQNGIHGTILQRITSVEMCGFQRFQAASLVALNSNLFMDETIGPVSIQKETSTSLRCAIGKDLLITANGFVEIPSASLQSQITDDGFEPVHPLGALDEHCETDYSEYEEDALDICSSVGSCMIPGSPKMSMERGSDIENVSGCNPDNPNLEDCLLQGCFGVPMLRGVPVTQDETCHLVCGPSTPVATSVSVVSGRCNFGNDDLCDQNCLYSGEVEVFEDSSCDVLARHVQPPVGSKVAKNTSVSEWIDLDGILPLGLMCPLTMDGRDTAENQLSKSGWDSTGPVHDDISPVERLALMDIEAGAPQLVGGTWDSARHYQESRTILHQVTPDGNGADRSRNSSLACQIDAAHDGNDLRTCDSANNFDCGNDGRVPKDEAAEHKVTPSKMENNENASSMERSGVWNDIHKASFEHSSMSLLGINSVPCSAQTGGAGDKALAVMTDINKSENRLISTTTGSWLDRMCQGISSLACGITRTGGSTDGTGVTEGGKQEFELVGMNNDGSQMEDVPCGATAHGMLGSVGGASKKYDRSWLERLWNAYQGLIQICMTQYQTTCSQ